MAEDAIDYTTNSVDVNLSKLWEIVEYRGACCAAWGHRDLDMT